MRIAFAALLIALAIIGCAKQAPACTTTCGSPEYLSDALQERFGFAPDSYTLVCAECNATRGGFVRATINRSGTVISVFSHDGWCSSGGTDCGWSRCVASSDRSVIDGIKDRTCRTVISYNVEGNDMCPGPKWDTTADAQDLCRTDAYETVNEEGIIAFSIIQQSGRCNASVSVGESCAGRP